MRVFVTGATGYIGSCVVRALVAGGHQVTGLVRSAEKQAALEKAGAAAVRGDYKDLPAYRDAALAHDAFIHTAMEYTPEGTAAGGRNPLALVEAARAAGGKLRTVVFTSGVWVLGPQPSPADEDTPTDRPAAAVTWRVAQEKDLLAAAAPGVAVSVVRPGMVYGRKGGFVGGWFAGAEKDGVVSYIGDGSNHWSLVHVDDLAVLYRLLVDKSARGIFHAVDGAHVRVADAARAVSLAAGRRGATKAVPVEAARTSMGPMADAAAMDQKVIAPRSLELGWKPTRPPLPESAETAYAEWKA